MATTPTARRHRQRTRTHADHLRTAAPFFTVLAARHGIPTPGAPTPSRTPATTPRAAEDTRPAQDRLPSLKARQ